MRREDDNQEANNLAKVLRYYNLIYDVSAANQKIICPFHDGDVNPSLLVYMSKGSWFCFGCQRNGDASKFVELMERKYNGLNELQACIKYYKILKSDKCSNIKISARQISKIKKPDRQLYNEAYDYYHGLRTVDWEHDTEDEILYARDYMIDRGYSVTTLNTVKAKITYNSSYSLIFPMLDNGKFRGWVSRTTIREIEKKRKYLYNEGFSRATTLVGDYGNKEYVIVVEGYMDRLRFVEYGLEKNVVAILGWKMSAQQEAKLKAAGITKIISCLDNDQCGRKGTLYLKSVFGPHNIVRWSYIKGIKDPGEMTKSQFNKMYNRTMKKYIEKYGA